MFEGSIKIKDKNIPCTSLGTAPFAGLTYFGHRSRLYQIDLYNNPENIQKIIRRSYNLGVRAIQLIPEPPVIRALTGAVESGLDFTIIGTIRAGRFQEDLKLLLDLEADAILLDEEYTDKLDTWELADLLDSINETGVVCGLITGFPRNTTRKLLASDILDLFDIYMIPLNKLGYMMDFPSFLEDERRELEEMILDTGKFIMAHKILAAGILKPDEAFEFLESVDYIDMVSIGVASIEEAEETFTLLFEY
ncbi:MAG TPA: hypothetical protein GXX31_06335 [Methanothermobacter sp.]|jgi:hypothetical protein|uniref:Indole-3-glycerol-phosphate synthase n=1 Tax=Methanothermobacter tenebrarum TaxID=680118 RepID=A0ABN6PA36_9EURY|nr:hypothetical protein [Methanothermobacter tenebrarum]MDD3454283.1 hypothetical protein [Methanobacteriales archaeon]MDI6881928.1 hypothetical protein [Methanothermobacter sp.]MDX9693415.1 hypothetical protein [Methanothermobacter sp.]BDH79070.1 hypothetical protein MTTB_04490 [Methanothermobacter tenebrarum]HHW16967.1 hypothetical protein [Methanothermobacter sp.]